MALLKERQYMMMMTHRCGLVNVLLFTVNNFQKIIVLFLNKTFKQSFKKVGRPVRLLNSEFSFISVY